MTLRDIGERWPHRSLLVAALLIIPVTATVSYGAFRNQRISHPDSRNPSERGSPHTSTFHPSSDTAVGIERYVSTRYSIGYPRAWHVYEYNDTHACVAISDTPNTMDIREGTVDFQRYRVATVCYYAGTMPATFPYTDGSAYNPTIQQFTINHHHGIRGKETSAIGEVERITLQDSVVSGYVEVTIEGEAQDIVAPMLATLSFVD